MMEPEIMEHLLFQCGLVNNIWLYAFSEFKHLSGYEFVANVKTVSFALMTIYVNKYMELI